MTNDIRIPAGQPTGGQFAAHDRTDGDVALTSGSLQTFTWFGRWEEDELVLEYAVPGDVEDDRPEYDYNGHQNFAASAEGATAEEAKAAVYAEYDPDDEA